MVDGFAAVVRGSNVEALCLQLSKDDTLILKANSAISQQMFYSTDERL